MIFALVRFFPVLAASVLAWVWLFPVLDSSGNASGFAVGIGIVALLINIVGGVFQNALQSDINATQDKADNLWKERKLQLIKKARSAKRKSIAMLSANACAIALAGVVISGVGTLSQQSHLTFSVLALVIALESLADAIYGIKVTHKTAEGVDVLLAQQSYYLTAKPYLESDERGLQSNSPVIATGRARIFPSP